LPLLCAARECRRTRPWETPITARRDELADVTKSLAKAEAGEAVDRKTIDRSVGVAQIKLSTAAMALRKTPWIDQDASNKWPARNQIEGNFDALEMKEKKRILKLLSEPSTNVLIAAGLLTRLKIRANRYPDMDRGAFGANDRAIKVISTEYNIGATNTLEVDAKPTAYGDDIWKNMQWHVLKRNFPNT